MSETICKLGVANDGVVYGTCEYTAKNADELSFVKGTPLKVTRKGDGTESEWWWASVEGQHGYVPQNLLSVSITYVTGSQPGRTKFLSRGISEF